MGQTAIATPNPATNDTVLDLSALANATASPAKRDATRVFIVLPAYNEEDNIGRLLQQLDAAAGRVTFPFHVIVVDDGSKDQTAQLVRSFPASIPVTLVQHAKNEGLGRTLRDGLLVAIEQSSEDDVIVTMDADCSQPPALIGRMVQGILEGRDVVVASRFMPTSRVEGVPWFRRVCSNGASYMFRVLMPIRGLKDFTCGFRAYRAPVLRRLVEQRGRNFIQSPGFDCMVELLANLRPERLVFGEEPIVLRYDWKSGPSKMRVFLTIRNLLKLAARESLGVRNSSPI